MAERLYDKVKNWHTGQEGYRPRLLGVNTPPIFKRARDAEAWVTHMRPIVENQRALWSALVEQQMLLKEMGIDGQAAEGGDQQSAPGV